MTSDRQIRANRANSARSTGPRTRDGKAVARLNAVRHGLSASRSREADAEEEVLILQRAIAGEYKEPELADSAEVIAQLEILLRRIRRARQGKGWRADSSSSVGAPQELNEKILERYELRALSRRNSAVRDFDLARAAIEVAREVRRARVRSNH
jgi:hypothetical protein